jgi:hypothetical protein
MVSGGHPVDLAVEIGLEPWALQCALPAHSGQKGERRPEFRLQMIFQMNSVDPRLGDLLV